MTSPPTEATSPLQISIGRARRGIGSLLPGQAYVGRPSPLGNPYALGRDGNREQVIAKYRRWLWARLQEHDSPQEQELRRLLTLAVAGKHLGVSPMTVRRAQLRGLEGLRMELCSHAHRTPSQPPDGSCP